MVRPNTVIERPVQEPQAIFDELCEKRKNLAGHMKMRTDGLKQVERYNKLVKEGALVRANKKKVEMDYDDKNASQKSRITSIKDEIEAVELKLMGLSLEHFKKTGTMLEVTKKQRGGTVKKIRIGFGFRQLSLGI